MEILYMLTGTFLFAAGFMTCHFFARNPEKKLSDSRYVDIPRARPSMRNPLRTYDIRYDRFKTKDTDLYQPVKPRRKTAVNEVEYGEEG